jgi:hypothetical protein
VTGRGSAVNHQRGAQAPLFAGRIRIVSGLLAAMAAATCLATPNDALKKATPSKQNGPAASQPREGVASKTTQDRIASVLEVFAGYNSNAAASPGETEFAGFLLSDQAEESASSVYGFALASSVKNRLNRVNEGQLQGSVSCRWFPSARFVDDCRITAGASIARTIGSGARLTAGVSGTSVWVDGTANRDTVGASFSLRKPMDARWNFIAEGSAVRISYDEERLAVLNVDRFLGAIGISGSGLGKRRWSVGAFVIGGGDEARDTRSTFGNHRYGARVAIERPVKPNALIVGEFSWLHSDYDGEFGFFLRDRVDDNASAAASYRLKLRENIAVSAIVRFTRVNSSIALFDFDRSEFIVSLRRDL